MRIRRLILENFGLFRGRTEIDLAPRERYRKTRPVVLIGGTNGAGKTTILDAIRLCLYGPLALGERVSQEEYDSHLRSCVHREEGMLVRPQSAAVGLEFEFGLGGKLQQYQVERNWDCNGRRVTTNLSVTRDGVPLDELEQAHADEFLRDLIPRGVSQLFFFDGEKIQQMAQASDDDAALADAIRELLGLDLVSRLRGDLSIYSSRLRESGAPKSLKKELQAVDKKLDELQQRKLAVVRNSDQSQSRVDRIREEIALLEQRLSRSGGSFAGERETLKAEESQLRLSVSEVEREIRELCSNLLPFTLASQLCRALREQIEAEKTVQDWQTHQTLLRGQVSELKESLDETLFPRGGQTRVSQTVRTKIVARVRQLLDELAQSPAAVPDTAVVHALSDGDQKRLLGAIDLILTEVPRQVGQLEAAYEERMRRLLQVKSALEKIPDDEVLEPLMKKVNELHRKLGKAEAAAKRAKEDKTAIEYEIKVHQRLRQKKEDELKAAAVSTERQELVDRVQAVLDDYSAALTKSKISDLSDAVADCFGQLWRKGDVLHQIKIDPETCSAMLLDKHGQVIPKERLSAGEKQIYAISILWALARVSGRVLPMVIDTPLARLDSKHRRHLVTRYFPHVSHQVIILSTDTEIDQTYFHELSPAISHAYHLRYDDNDGRTLVEEGYFWGRREAEVTT
ncbi:MAG: DNA sulfur modification protein DndD [Planctomycetaceae bacterium]|nr:DNA sulfur modification protein DndD [Planctomycetaceae bacterium]